MNTTTALLVVDVVVAVDDVPVVCTNACAYTSASSVYFTVVENGRGIR